MPVPKEPRNTTIHEEARRLIADPERSRHGRRFRSKRFIQFDDIRLLEPRRPARQTWP
ncbi:MAG: hypothetical protein KGQ57_11180 [Burkholderiales bacterium]|nr:hypothetical protein [Burkholderiales bacterium]